MKVNRLKSEVIDGFGVGGAGRLDKGCGCQTYRQAEKGEFAHFFLQWEQTHDS
jgi:hypothetical protein